MPQLYQNRDFPLANRENIRFRFQKTEYICTRNKKIRVGDQIEYNCYKLKSHSAPQFTKSRGGYKNKIRKDPSKQSISNNTKILT